MENNYSDYKKALKAKYEQEKTGVNTSFLLQLTPARLRDLTLYVFRETTNPDDLKTFQLFMGFPFDAGNIQKIKNKIDAFRPLISFLKNQSDLANPGSVEMLAVLLDFTPRPFHKFRKKTVINENTFTDIDTEEKKNDIIERVENTPHENETTEIDESKIEVVDEGTQDEVFQDEIIHPKNSSLIHLMSSGENKESVPKRNKISVKQKTFLATGLGILALGTSVFYNVKMSSQQECMQWNNDRYIAVDCENTTNGIMGITSAIPIDISVIEKFRKIAVDSTTVFFNAKGDPIVWYSKKPSGEIDFFNQPGLHPETQATLRKITPHIINKYVLLNE